MPCCVYNLLSLLVSSLSGLSDYNNANNCRNMTTFEEKTARSLLVVAPAPPDQVAYDAFSEEVTAYSSKEPFNFTASLFAMSWKKHVSIYAANLYDSLFLYARALDKLRVERNGTHIQKLARDGRGIFKAIIDMKSYNSKNYFVFWIFLLELARTLPGHQNFRCQCRIPTPKNMGVSVSVEFWHQQIWLSVSVSDSLIPKILVSGSEVRNTKKVSVLNFNTIRVSVTAKSNFCALLFAAAAKWCRVD